jgi:hypothetical protein
MKTIEQLVKETAEALMPDMEANDADYLVLAYGADGRIHCCTNMDNDDLVGVLETIAQQETQEEPTGTKN